MKLLNQAETAKAIKSIRTRAANVQKDIHLCAVSTLAHMRDHGDYTGAVLLMNALPSGQRVKGLAAWYKNFSGGKFTLRQDKKQGNIWVGALQSKADGRVDEDFNVDEAAKITFADFTAEAAPQQVTPDSIKKYLDRLIANDETIKDALGKDQPKVTEAAKQTATQMLALIAA
jgi:hypothetical protein